MWRPKAVSQDHETSVLSPTFVVAIPKGGPSEEGIAGKKARRVEVVTASREHENPKDRHTCYPGSRHHCHTTLPHVILCQHRQKNDHSFTDAPSTLDLVHICVCVYRCICLFVCLSMQEFDCAHSAFHDIVYLIVYLNDYCVPFLLKFSERISQIPNREHFDQKSNATICIK